MLSDVLLKKFLSQKDIKDSKCIMTIQIADGSNNIYDKFSVEFDYKGLIITPNEGSISSGNSVQFKARIGSDDVTNSIEWEVEQQDDNLNFSSSTKGLLNTQKGILEPKEYIIKAKYIYDNKEIIEKTIIKITPGTSLLYIDPNEKTLFPGQTYQFKAFLNNAPVTEVFWEAIDGLELGAKITPDGTYTAPSQAGTYNIKTTYKTISVTAPMQNNINRAALELSASAKIIVTSYESESLSVSPQNILCNIDGSEYFNVIVKGTSNTGIDVSIIEQDGGSIVAPDSQWPNRYKYVAPKKEKPYYETDSAVYHIVVKTLTNPSLTQTINVTVNRPFLKTDLKKYDRYYLIYSGIFSKELLYNGSSTAVYSGTEKFEKYHGSMKGYTDEACSQLKFFGEYYNNLKTGKWVTYHYDDGTNRNVYYIENFSDGVLNGVYEDYGYATGALWQRGEYQNNKRINNWVIYNADGTKSEEGPYYSYQDETTWVHKKHGIWIVYKTGEKIDHTEEYSLGTVIKTIWY